MIDIKIEKGKKLITLSALGHASYAAYGSDIVCAGVSGIIMGLCASLDSSRTESLIASGKAIVRARNNQKARYMFHFAEKALGLIAAEYPRCVRLSVHNNTPKA